MHKKFFFILFFLLFLTPNYLLAEVSTDALISFAKKQNLHIHPQWLRLLYYQKNKLASGYKSLADDEKFFLSGISGKKNPWLELKANIKEFYLNSSAKTYCRFPARFAWLNKELGLEHKNTLLKNCQDLQEWIELINAESISLIFPTAYLNNPASAFGHTLLRLNFKGQTEKNSLLAYTANYSAQTNGENAILYATKGIFGGYSGFFSVSPYYKLIKRYSDVESRDIWEYQLKLDSERVNFLVMHLWELKNIGFDYYYFDENCSFYIIALLDVLLPDLNLLDKLNSWVLPLDTIRLLKTKSNLIDKVTFRPSKATKLQKKIKTTNKNSKKYALRIIKNSALETKELSKLDDLRQAESLVKI